VLADMKDFIGTRNDVLILALRDRRDGGLGFQPDLTGDKVLC